MKLSTIVKHFVWIGVLAHTLPSCVYAFSVYFRPRLYEVVVLPKDHLLVTTFAAFTYKIQIAIYIQTVFYFICEVVVINPRKFEWFILPLIGRLFFDTERSMLWEQIGERLKVSPVRGMIDGDIPSLSFFS